jgi:hypothetical protein
MLLHEIKNVQPKVNAAAIVEQIDAAIVTELFGGMGAIGSSVMGGLRSGAQRAGAAVQQGAAAVKDTYNQGEIQTLVKKYETLKQQLIALIQKNPQAFGQQPQQAQQPAPQQAQQAAPLAPAYQINREGLTSTDVAILTELFGGLGALFGAAKSGAGQIGSRVVQAGKQAGQQMKGTYVKGEAQAIFAKMYEVAKALVARGYKFPANDMDVYAKLEQAVKGR